MPGNEVERLLEVAEGLVNRRAFAAATDVYAEVLRHDPGRGRAWYGAAVVAAQQGDGGVARRLLAAGIALDPGEAELHLGRALIEPAVDPATRWRIVTRGLSAGSTSFGSLYAAARAARQFGVRAQERRLLMRAIAVEPSSPGPVTDLATGVDGAPSPLWLPRSVALENNAFALARLGDSALAAGDRVRALRSYRRVLAAEPGVADLQYNYGNVLAAIDRREEGIGTLRRCLALDREHLDAWANLGGYLLGLGAIGLSVESLRRALTLRPSHVNALSNLGRWSYQYASAEMSLRWLERAIAGDPGHAESRWNRALALLRRGELRRGWREYEWRFGSGRSHGVRPFGQPWWQGQGLTGGRLLVWGEQGIGDEVVYGSMLPDLVRMGVPTVVECDPRLASILRRSVPEIEVVARRDPPDTRLSAPDLVSQSAMASLAKWLRPTIDAFPRGRPYLTPDSTRARSSRAWLASLGARPKIGIAWRSLRSDAASLLLHSRITDWKPILGRRDVDFVNLQYGDVVEELAAAKLTFGSEVHVQPELDLFHDLEGVLALGSELDLVLSTTSSAFCLPAMAGVRSWLLMHSSDYIRLGASDVPWFPSTRVFLRSTTEGWDETLAEMSDSLDAFILSRDR
jgi:tetratricopeptide (TPR) repeat protein